MKRKEVSIRVDENYYKQLDKARREFMERMKLNRLSSRAFTNILANQNIINPPNKFKIRRGRNDKQKRRRY